MENTTQQTGYPSIDKPWLKYYSKEAIDMPLPECSVYENVYQNNKGNLSDIAINYFGRRISYGELFQNVDKTKSALLEYGIEPGDIVVMLTTATPEMLYLTLALSRIGAVANMINPLFSTEEISARINETDASLLFVLDQLYDKVKGIIPNTCIKDTIIISVCNEMPPVIRALAGIKKNKKISYNANIRKWTAFLKDAKMQKEDFEYRKEHPLVMVYSSGTTGASKGIVLTNDGINAVIANYLTPDFPCERGETFLQIIPVWFSTGMVLCLLMPLCLGLTVILEPVFGKENFAKDIKKYKPNITFAPKSLWMYVLRAEDMKKCDYSYIRYPGAGGEQMLEREENQINEYLKERGCKAPLLKGYGMCELGSTVATDSAFLRKPHSTGIPIKGVIVAAFDIETNAELPYGERGEIRVLSVARMKEYYKNPQATKEYFYEDKVGNLWGKTGDMGYVDEDGFVYILGRASDMFLTKKDKKVYCFDIENVVLENPNVIQCKAMGIEKEGDCIPVTHVVLKASTEEEKQKILKQIYESCKEQLPEFSVPREFKVWESFPLKLSGKQDTEGMRKDGRAFVSFD